MTEDRPRCRFCGSVATVVATFTHGCVCYPDDRVQALCEQHWHNSMPLGGRDGRAQVVADIFEGDDLAEALKELQT